MERKPFNANELEIAGVYPAAYNSMGIPAVEEPRQNRPITPKENLKLALSGEKPWWVPFTGWAFCDVLVFRPRLHPDNVVTHLIFDGGEPYPYTANSMTSSWYDLVWDFVPQVGGATVHPGNPKVPDMSCWEQYISIPDPDDLDWEACKRENEVYCNSDKLVQLGILSGWWERLISLMDVESAAVALIDEEQQEGVHRFFDLHTNLLIGYVDRMSNILPIDNVLVHDDWGHQNGPFFSPDVCCEMIVPYLKRLIDFCHSKGISFELHSCGRNETNVPCMIEAGVDMWGGQQELNDFEKLAEQYKDSPIVFAFSPDHIPEGVSDGELRETARQWVLRHKDHHVAFCGKDIPAVLKAAVYEFSRKLYAGEEI